MNKKIKAKWLAALRSGNYKQGRDVLRNGDRFCCLGVLCDVVNKKLWQAPNPDGQLFDNNSGTLPEDIREQLGIPVSTLDHLISMNDDNRNEFTTIAKWIEKNL